MAGFQGITTFRSLCSMGPWLAWERNKWKNLLGSHIAKFNLLWLVREEEIYKIPSNFIDETPEKGLVVTCSPQLAVLAHNSVGCFVTHCGPNSTMEELSLGVPKLAVPQWSDQPTNAKFVADVWKVGVRVKVDDEGIVRKEEIVRCAEKVMEDESRNKIRSNSDNWKLLAREAVDEGGISDRNMEEFVSMIVSSQNIVY